MAYRRVLSIQSNLLGRSLSPISFTYISHYNRCKKSEELHSYGSNMEAFSKQRRSLVSYAFLRTSYGLTGNGRSLIRGISTSSGEASETVASIFEVAIAASDSAFPVAAVQYLIDGVHTLTGWASIAVATFLVRGAMVPLYIKVLRKHTVIFMLMTAQLIIITRETEAKMYTDPIAAEKGVWKIVDILKKGGISPYMNSLAEGSMILTFYLAVLNMAEKVPSFKTGGTLWFTDLSTPDAMYIFPISVALIYIVPSELAAKKIKAPVGNQLFVPYRNLTRALAVIWLPLTISLPNAVFCFWITSRIFVICFRHVTRYPRVRKALGIQSMIPAPPFKSSTDNRNK